MTKLKMSNFDQFATPYEFGKVPMPRRPMRTSSIPGLGCLGYLLLLPIGYVISVLWWSLFLMIGVHAAHAETWSYLYTCTHWGALTPFVAG